LEGRQSDFADLACFLFIFYLKSNMRKRNVVAGAIAGTAAMTLFSYFLSSKKDKDFREPALLGKMVKRILPGSEETVSEIAG
jgi:hypothetical protein